MKAGLSHCLPVMTRKMPSGRIFKDAGSKRKSMEQTLYLLRKMSGRILPAYDARLSRDLIFTLVVGLLTVLLLYMHTGFERPSIHGVMAKAGF